MRIADRLFVDFHACRAIHLIIRHLHLDRRHNVAQRVNQAHVVGVNSFRRILEGMNAVWQNFPDKVFRQIFNAGIEARDSRVFQFRNSLCEFFHDIHIYNPFLGLCPKPQQGTEFPAPSKFDCCAIKNVYNIFYSFIAKR